MAAVSQPPGTDAADRVSTLPAAGEVPAFYSIAELAERWRCSRGSVRSWLRGASVVRFASKDGKGRVLVPRRVVLRVEREHMVQFE